jgi:pyruvate/2-oxoglutarate/acetoin dehydrogenase E1 component
MTMVEAVRLDMDEELARDERVFIVGEDVGPRGGVFRATQGLFAKYGEKRVIDSPLAELSIVGRHRCRAVLFSSICEIQLQISSIGLQSNVSEAAKMRYRSGGVDCAAGDRAPHGGGIGGNTTRNRWSLRPRSRVEGRHPLHGARRARAAQERRARSWAGDLLRAQEGLPPDPRPGGGR